jgi:hypothetical protein
MTKGAPSLILASDFRESTATSFKSEDNVAFRAGTVSSPASFSNWLKPAVKASVQAQIRRPKPRRPKEGRNPKTEK